MDHDESSGDERAGDGATFESLLKDSGYLSATMKRQILRTMVKSLPAPVQNRVKALKNLQMDYLNLEAKFYEEVYQIEKKYIALYQPIMEKRSKIIAGAVEPTEEEANYQSAGEEEDEEMSEKMREITLEMKKNSVMKVPDDVKGIPNFWLTVFKTTEVLADMIQPHDEPILKELHDIKIIHDANDMAYTLEFHFAANEFFSDTILTKKYFMRSELDKEDPFNFEGPEIYKCTGCVINWLPGKNVTVKTIKKKQKHKARGAVRTITKQVPNDSFFNFFSPPISNEEAKLDDDSQAILASDFEIGHFLRVRIIPKAILYFTGDYVDEDDDDDEEEEEEASEEETDSDEDGGDGGHHGHGHHGKMNKKGGGGANNQQQPAECKQQ